MSKAACYMIALSLPLSLSIFIPGSNGVLVASNVRHAWDVKLSNSIA